MHVLSRLLKRRERLMRVTFLHVGVAHKTQGHTSIEGVWGTREAALARLESGLPFASRRFDKPGTPRSVGLQPRVAEGFTNGLGPGHSRQSLGKCSHEVI